MQMSKLLTFLLRSSAFFFFFFVLSFCENHHPSLHQQLLASRSHGQYLLEPRAGYCVGGGGRRAVRSYVGSGGQ